MLRPKASKPPIAMKKIIALLLLLPLAPALYAQEASTLVLPETAGAASFIPIPKLRQHNYGAIIGIQRGRTTAFEMGAEMHWRKISLFKPHIWGANAQVEYSFSDHIVGYKAGVWRKQGRVNLTYGANLVYFNNFEGGQQFGIGPAVGFRFAGLHLINGVNILAGDMKSDKTGAATMGANTLYMSLRYYFPVQNKFTWDRKNKNKKGKEGGGLFRKKEEEKAPERKGLFAPRKQEPEKRKGLFGSKKEEPKEEPKGLKRIFGKKSE
ncbi:hypothetical protein BUE76_04430 [Cnuella takakiae]|nr:hypothetical protein BUE76_04430 [Cnuella takakiae]